VQQPAAQLIPPATLRQGTHVPEAPWAEPLNTGKLGAEILGKPVNHLRSPAFGLLPVQDVAANRPVQQNEFPVDGKRGAHLGGADALLDVFERATGYCTSTGDGLEESGPIPHGSAHWPAAKSLSHL
jgi:hypothetical protein